MKQQAQNSNHNYKGNQSQRAIIREIGIYAWCVRNNKCVRCHVLPPAPGVRKCPKCIIKKRVENKRRREIHKMNGICPKCNKKAKPGRTHCQKHITEQLKSLQKYRTKILNEEKS